MTFLKENILLLLSGIVFVFLSVYFIWNDQAYLNLFPFALMAVYFAIYYTDYTFLGLAAATPLSVNIEEFTDSFGLFIPTEPVLFGFLIMFFFLQVKKPIIDNRVWNHPIILAVAFYLFWIIVTSITSSHPVVSLKFFLSRLWFFIPVLVMGTYFFRKTEHIKYFLWLFTAGMTIAIMYTLVVHAQYRFGEKEGHWVMWPFFKDHTIYGAIVALIVPIVFGLFFSKKHNPLIQALLISFIVVVMLGLYFSYTRAAWLSVIAALGVWTLIRMRIHYGWVLGIGLAAGGILFVSWDAIQMELARNKYEHTTEDFGERLQSATNVTTDASNLERLNRWSCAIAMFEQRPVFGYGPGTYAFEYAPFQEPENLTIISTNFGDMGNAHSEYLGPLAEMGLVGMISMILIVIAIFYKGISLYYAWPDEDKEMKTIIMAMILSLVTYFVHAFLNNFLDTDKAAVPIWGMCAAFIALELKLANRSTSKV
jgi:putative inorganic carbon (HCO3(-)) transporter